MRAQGLGAIRVAGIFFQNHAFAELPINSSTLARHDIAVLYIFSRYAFSCTISAS